MFCKFCGNQIKDNAKFCINCGASQDTLSSKAAIFKNKHFLIVTGITIFIIICATVYLSQKKSDTPTKEQRDHDIASAVVNIYCTGKKDEDASGGSGTILTEDGLVMTNAHIIPEGDSKDISCIVILPDPTNGSPDEMYTAYPIVVPKLSEKYDLAFVQIDDVYYDHEENKAYGEYPKKFAAYDSAKYCKDQDIKLGEPVRIYGYPSISGGYALTITDGIVSSLLPDEGYIITSAKISHGNSGGLAVDENGCQIGIPAMVSSDDSESLGVIISNNLIEEFTSEVHTYLDNN